VTNLATSPAGEGQRETTQQQLNRTTTKDDVGQVKLQSLAYKSALFTENNLSYLSYKIMKFI
jgi:hypothetical protein